MNDFKRYKHFTIEPPTFILENNKLYLTCKYACDDSLKFEENFVFTFPDTFNCRDDQDLEKAANLCAIAAAPSYYKATIAENIDIAFPVTLDTKIWAQAIFDEGLREFRFKNDIALSEIPILNIEQIPSTPREQTTNASTRFVVPIGGGKDSVTTLEIVKQSAGAENPVDKSIVGFSVGDFEPINRCAKVAGVELIKVERKIDEKLFELNEAGAPNGHVPVTALTSMLANLGALAIGFDAVAMSNESSADEPTRIIKGEQVNHQWSKSTHAEKLLRNALSSTGVAIKYFSALRSLSEFQIFEMFSSFDQYHRAFTSCNRSFHIDENKRQQSWCNNCDKCRFVFFGLSAFRGEKYASEIFGGNLFEDPTQTQGFLDLLGKNNQKPFECVGTVKESRLLARKCVQIDSIANSVVGTALVEELNMLSELVEKYVEDKSINFVPESILATIKKIQVSNFSKRLSDSLGNASVGVVGLGRDTSAIIRFLETNANIRSVEIFVPSNENMSQSQLIEVLKDNGLGNSKVEFQLRNSFGSLDADQIFVSPGISRYLPEIKALTDRATTPLAWWLNQMKLAFPEKCFIGVTGTKGKSTTSSMLAHVLDKSLVAGNLGNAVGDISIEQILFADYIVLEISSYQSSYVTNPPDVVCVTSLFDCHIDWHLTPENYRRDKLNIALRGPAEIIASDSIADFAPTLIRMRQQLKDQGINLGPREIVDVITLVPSANMSLLERNKQMVREIVGVVAPTMSDDELERKLETFKELKHRQEIIAVKNGITFVSDVLSTAPFATLAAVDDFALRYSEATIYLLCGGAYSQVDLDELTTGLNARKDRVFTIALPETGHMIANRLENFEKCDELVDGVAFAARTAQAGDIVLLAPGAPSFHRYKNYEQLAAHFTSLVSNM